MPIAPSRDIVHVGGEVFASVQEPSDKSVFWGELFMEKERLFFRKELTTEVASFSIKDTFQMSVRCLWQPVARTKVGHRPGTTIALFHSLEFPLTTSWTWVKLARPLYKSGFSVVMIDLPGFGRSKMNMDPAVKLEEWSHQDWHILSQTLDELRVHSVLTICIGKICGTILRILMRSPHSLGKEHIFLEPIVDPAEVLSDIAGEPPPGAGSNWREKMREKYRDALEKVLRNSKARIWSMHDRDRMTKPLFDTQALLADVMQHPVLVSRTRITELSKSDICSCHMGAKLPFSFLYPRKDLVEDIVQFFIDREKGLDTVMSMPKYIAADPRYADDNWAPVMCPKFLAMSHQAAELASPKEVLMDAENPLRAIMRKSRKQELIKSEKTLLGASRKHQSKLQEDAKDELGEVGTLARARQRAGPEAAKHIQWSDYSQTKHQVRMIQSRNQCTMFTSASDAFNLTGGSETSEGFRVGLLSKLSPTQRAFVSDHQSLEHVEEEDNGLNAARNGENSPGGFKPITAGKMATVLARARGQQQRLEDEVARGGTGSRSSSRPGSTNHSRAASTLPPARTPPMSASTSRRPSAFAVIDENAAAPKRPTPLPIMSKSMPNLPDVGGSRGSMRSKSNLALTEGSGGAGGTGDLLPSRPRTTTESRSSSTLSSGGLARNKRSRSNISVTVVEPPKEDEVEAE